MTAGGGIESAEAPPLSRLRRRERAWLEMVVTDYQFIHLGIGIVGNALFVVGSVLFFPRFESLVTVAVWFFVVGSSLMLCGAIGEVAKRYYESRHRRTAR